MIIDDDLVCHLNKFAPRCSQLDGAGCLRPAPSPGDMTTAQKVSDQTLAWSPLNAALSTSCGLRQSLPAPARSTVEASENTEKKSLSESQGDSW